jgi:anti-sigma regulatory factor (Ser/Thr protein kinase)
MNNWLTIKQVESIQWAVQKQRPVGEFVNSLRNATLPALLEYLSLQAHYGINAVPHLPTAISHSAMYQSLNGVLVPAKGNTERRSNNTRGGRIDTHPFEFISISAEEELDQESADDPPKPWQLFAIRFSRSAQAAGFNSTVANGLMAALYEMARNALEHAESPTSPLVGYHAEEGMALFCVVDAGRGVLESLRKCPEYSQLTRHDEALSLAIQDGTSRHGARKGGLGFREVFRALADFNGQLRFRTGSACLDISGVDCGPNHGLHHYVPFLNGFHVSVCCRTEPPRIDDPPAI